MNILPNSDQTDIRTMLGEGASILSDLHNATVYGTMRTWVPVEKQDMRAFMLDRITRAIFACAQAQILIMTMDEGDLPNFLLMSESRNN